MLDKNILPSIWRRKEADNVMDFGDPEPPYLPKTNILRKAKEQKKNKDLGISLIDPIQSIRKMKYECHVGHIHSIGFDPFFVHYWTQEQMTIYLKNSYNICIDATGSLVKKLRKENNELSAHIYLYEIVAETPNTKMPVFQMLSEVQNTNAILYWLNEIIRIGSTYKTNFPIPKQIVTDFDKALMGAVVRSFGNCKNLKDYLQQCFNYVTNTPYCLPSCCLRLDVAHYMNLIARWKELNQVHPRVRTFYLLIMSYLTKITDFDEYKNTMQNIIILCNSEGYGKDENGLNSLSQDAYEFLKQRIVDPNLLTLRENLTDNKSEEEIDIDDEDDFINDDTNIENDTNIYTWTKDFFHDISQKISKTGDDINIYYVPLLTKKIKKLVPYFPVYTSVMLDIFQCSKFSATSAAVEGEFNDLKNRVLKNDCRPMRSDKFVSLHLKSFSGRAKLAAADCENKFIKENKKESQDHNKSLVTECTLNTEEKSSMDFPSFSLENEEIHDLLLEQNWKNKNIPTKIKRTYLQGRPDWNTISIAKNAVGITLLKNGNLCPALSEKELTYIVQNTCGFDSLVHILASATMYETFNNILKTQTTEIFLFIKQYLQGPTKDRRRKFTKKEQNY